MGAPDVSTAIISAATVGVSTGLAWLAARTKGRFSLMAKREDDGTTIRAELRARNAVLEAELERWKNKYWELIEKNAAEQIECQWRVSVLELELAHFKG